MMAQQIQIILNQIKAIMICTSVSVDLDKMSGLPYRELLYLFKIDIER